MCPCLSQTNPDPVPSGTSSTFREKNPRRTIVLFVMKTTDLDASRKVSTTCRSPAMTCDELSSSAAAGATFDTDGLPKHAPRMKLPSTASDAINIVKARPALRRPLELWLLGFMVSPSDPSASVKDDRGGKTFQRPRGILVPTIAVRDDLDKRRGAFLRSRHFFSDSS